MWPTPVYHKHPAVTLKLPRNTHGVYAIINRLNGKVYIGGASCLSRRWSTHRCYLAKGTHGSRLLQSEFNESPESFEIVLIEFVAQKTQIYVREQFWIDFYQSYKPELGYNGRRTAATNLGFKMRESAKRKVSLANKGRKRTEEMRKAQSDRQRGLKRKPLTQEQKQNLIRYSLGVKRSPESIAKRRATMAERKRLWTPVIQMDLDGNEIARYDSITIASKAMGRENASAINQVFSGILKTAFGFKWRKA